MVHGDCIYSAKGPSGSWRCAPGIWVGEQLLNYVSSWTPHFRSGYQLPNLTPLDNRI